MANLSTARTRLGLFGYATRPGVFGVVAPTPSPEVGSTPGFVTCEDAVVTLLAGRDATALSQVEYLSLPGISGNYASTPDSAVVSITGDIDIRVRVAPDDWTFAVFQTFVAKWSSAPNFSFIFGANTITGLLAFYISADGIGNAAVFSDVLHGFADGSPGWLRVTRAQFSGETKFFESSDGVVWTQLGASKILSAGSAISDGTAVLEVGSQSSGTINLWSGKLYYAEVRNGIDGTVVAKFDPANDAQAGSASFTSATGEVWTINGSGIPLAQLIAATGSLILAASDAVVTLAVANDHA